MSTSQARFQKKAEATTSCQGIIHTQRGAVRFNGSVLDTPFKQSPELSNGKKLKDRFAIVYHFERTEKVSLSMENVTQDLDIAFINENGQIYHYYKIAKAGSGSFYPSVFPAKKVIQIKSGFLEKHGIRLYDFVSISNNV